LTSAAAAAAADRPATHWPAIAAVLGAGLAVALNIGKVSVALPTLRDEVGLSLVQAGWVSSMLTTVAVCCAALIGMWVGRLGAWRMVTAGLLLCSLASAGAVLGQASWPALMVSRFFEGLGFMLVAVACPALITEASMAQDRRFALGLWSSYMPLGAGLAMAVSPLLLPALGWRGLWLVTSAALLAAALALYWLRQAFARHRQTPARAGDPPPSFFLPVRQALSQPLPWLLALAFGMWAIQHFALIVWMPTYLREARQIGGTAAALLTAGMLIACVPGNLLGGSLVQRGVPRGWLIAGGEAAAGLGALIYTAEALPDLLRYAAAVVVSFAGGVIPAAVMASSTALARSPQQIGTLQGLYLQGAQLGQFLGTPAIAAVVAAQGHWSASLWVTAAASAVGIALGLAAQRMESRFTVQEQAAQSP
jgi:MFS transporter, CP family, cyanate transporter